MGREDTTPSGRSCIGCGYALDGLTVNRCPECGREFDPKESWTYAAAGLPVHWQSPIVVAILIVIFLYLPSIGGSHRRPPTSVDLLREFWFVLVLTAAGAFVAANGVSGSRLIGRIACCLGLLLFGILFACTVFAIAHP